MRLIMMCLISFKSLHSIHKNSGQLTKIVTEPNFGADLRFTRQNKKSSSIPCEPRKLFGVKGQNLRFFEFFPIAKSYRNNISDQRFNQRE